MDTAQGKEISKLHCTFCKRSRKGMISWVLIDNESLNGTFVNKQRIERVVLKHGDEIVFGGGSEFEVGDFLNTTETAECRYVYYIIPPPVHFSSIIDPNATPPIKVTCSICYETLASPSLLPCNHIFCTACVKQWAKHAAMNNTPCVCPLCRTEFSLRHVTAKESLMSSDGLIVLDVVPFLGKLGLVSCHSLRKVNILKKWKAKHKSIFWSCFEKIRENEHQNMLFLHLTKATYWYVNDASDEELCEAMENLECKNRPEARNDRLREIMEVILMKMVHPPSRRLYVLQQKQVYN